MLTCEQKMQLLGSALTSLASRGSASISFGPIGLKKYYTVSLEEVFSVLESEEWDRVSHHPDVSSAAVVVRLGPLPVLVGDGQNHVGLAVRVGRGVVRVAVIA